MELMRFYAESYVRIVKYLKELEVILTFDASQSTAAKREYLTAAESQEATAFLAFTSAGCKEIGLEVCALHASELLGKLHRRELTAHDVQALHEALDRELSCNFYVGIAQSRKDYYCKSQKGWEEIIAKFPSAIDDIEEMNKCFALCRYPAAAFHSLMVLEHGLVALGHLLNVNDPKRGWDASCKALEKVVAAGHSANSTGLPFEFLEQLNACVQTMKFAWRNKVNHATGKPVVMHGGFAPYVTEEIIMATRSFMRRLAERLPSAEDRMMEGL